MICKKVYICHPYSGDPEGNIKKVEDICRKINEENGRKGGDGPVSALVVPVAVHLLFPRFMDEKHLGHDIVMLFCKEMMKGCAEVWICTEEVTEGMREEISFAVGAGVRLIWKIDDWS